MFICQQCHRQTRAGEPAHTEVIETRSHVHRERTYRLRGDRKERHDRGGTGTQIVRELRVCSACAAGPPESQLLPPLKISPNVPC